MDENNIGLLDDAYQETFEEAVDRGVSKLEAHKEAVVAASMMLSALTSVEDDDARQQVIALNFRPNVD